jgi:predicted nucleotidyltransferase
MVGLQGRHRKALMGFRDRVVNELGNYINSILVYGSIAKGEAEVNSDIDLLIIGRDKSIRNKV